MTQDTCLAIPHVRPIFCFQKKDIVAIERRGSAWHLGSLGICFIRSSNLEKPGIGIRVYHAWFSCPTLRTEQLAIRTNAKKKFCIRQKRC